MLLDPKAAIRDFVRVAELAGLEIKQTDIRHEYLHAPHSQPRLPNGLFAVYVFSLASDPSVVIKVGKAGPKSKARFESQHYLPGSCNSNVSRSLLADVTCWLRLGISALDEQTVGDWLRNNTRRDHFFFENKVQVVNLFEAFLHCKLDPLFEG